MELELSQTKSRPTISPELKISTGVVVSDGENLTVLSDLAP